MATTHHIAPDHLPLLMRMQHVLEFLQTQQQQLDNELRIIERHGAQKQAELIAFLQQAYGIDAAHTPWSLDTEHSVITTPDAEPAPHGAPPTEPEAPIAEPIVEPIAEPMNREPATIRETVEEPIPLPRAARNRPRR